MLGWDTHSTADSVGRRIATLRDELDNLQLSVRHSGSGLGRLASDAHDWVSEHAETLARPGLRAIRRYVEPAHRPMPVLPVLAAAVVVGLGVGAVLYAVSRGKSPSSDAADEDGEPYYPTAE
ncbi:hypothetical protein ABLE93_12455 [Xanthobacter sp. KR7-65]|uniref:hypothetical protein n=1 Tax=Xanthobacter sp. KR7-65 TaxID=3156612 RepID=UPI0032B57B91